MRGVGLSSAVAVVDDPELARWLTELVPAAVLADEPIPERRRPAEPPRWRLAGRG